MLKIKNIRMYSSDGDSSFKFCDKQMKTYKTNLPITNPTKKIESDCIVVPLYKVSLENFIKDTIKVIKAQQADNKKDFDLHIVVSNGEVGICASGDKLIPTGTLKEVEINL